MNPPISVNEVHLSVAHRAERIATNELMDASFVFTGQRAKRTPTYNTDFSYKYTRNKRDKALVVIRQMDCEILRFQFANLM